MADRRRCDWCGRAAQAIGDDGARELGWLVGATAMCVDCQGPCTGCGQQECACDDTVHVMPNNDVIEHTFGDCPCGPTDDPVMREDGSVGWVAVHRSLDGREMKEGN